MQLRKKIILLLVAVITISVIGNYTIQRVAMDPSFRRLEHDHAIENWERCRNAITRDVEGLSLLCFDWASWDHAYEFVQGKNPGFYEENLQNPEWFVDQSIDVLYFVRPDGEVFWRHTAADESGEPSNLAWLPGDRLPADHPLLKVVPDKESNVTGLMRSELGIVMLAARPILTSNNEGPLAGVLIFGRRLDEESIAGIRERTSVDFTVLDADGPELSVQDAAAKASDEPLEELVDSSRLAVRGTLKDLAGQPAVLVKTSGDRRISQEGRDALQFATVSIVGAGLLTLVVLHAAMRRLVVHPLAALTQHAASVGNAGRAIDKVDLSRGDEIGTLARAYQQMLDQLEEYRINSVTMSRQAGKAEVSAGVLHNVGNALTNVGVLAETLSTRLVKSRVPALAKVANLLQENRGNLPAFFAPGRQGEQVVEYIGQLSTHLGQESAAAQQDIAGLRDGLQHIRQIVASHQNIASSAGVVEDLDVREEVRRSLALVEESMRRHGIEVRVEGPAGCTAVCDRSKLSQVLVNLLTNAKQSLVASATPDAAIVLRVESRADGGAVIEVCDNGPGVPMEHRDRLYTKGFTTRPGGQGIGLHYSWLAAREMRGALSLVTDGASGGATFRVELPPSVRAERRAAA